MPSRSFVLSAISALAAQRELGARRAVFRRPHAIPPWVLWPGTVLAVTIAILLALISGLHVVALVLLGAWAAGVLLFRYGLANELAVVYEHGLVSGRAGQLRSVRWDEVRYYWLDVADMAILPRADALAGTGMPGAPGMSGKDGRLIVRRVTGTGRLQQLIDAELAPPALARGQAQLAADGRADYPPLTITPAGIFALRKSGTDNAPWAAVDSYKRDGGRLAINAFVNDPVKGRIVKQWFRGLVADATAAEQLMDATDPSPNPAPSASQPAPGRPRVPLRRRIRWQAVLFTVLVLGGALITLIHPAVNGLGYAGACDGQGSAKAAAYTGPGPHPIDFEGGSAGFGGVSDNAGVLAGETAGWIPANAAAVQLVACVTGAPTNDQLDDCEYDTADVPMLAEAYTITVYAARTGARVLAPQTIDGDNDDCPATITTVNGQGPSQFYSTLTEDDVEATIGNLVTNPAS